MSGLPSTWSEDDVVNWLSSEELPSLIKTFEGYRVDGESLLQLDEKILVLWGVKNNDRRILLKKVEELKSASAPIPSGGLVSSLVIMFPHLSLDTIKRAADTNNYNQDEAIKALKAKRPNKSRRSGSTSSETTGLRETLRGKPRRETMQFKSDSKFNFILSDIVKADMPMFEELCELFPDQDPEMVDTALTLAKGNYDDAVEQLLSLNPDPHSVIVYENVSSFAQDESPYMSVTRSGFNDEDIFDSEGGTLPRHLSASVEGDDEEEESNSMIKKMLDFLDDPNGTESRRKTMYFPITFKASFDDDSPPPVMRDRKPILDLAHSASVDPSDLNHPFQGDAKDLRQSERNFLHESKLLDDSMLNILQRNRWQYRPDVVSSGILERLGAVDVKRQEAIAEIVTSEQAYQQDLQILIDLVIEPLNKLFTLSGEMKSSSKKTVQPKDFTASGVAKMKTWVTSLQGIGKQFLSSLLQRQSQSIVVQTMSDIIIQFAPRLKRVFVAYCSVCFHLQRATESTDAPVKELLDSAAKDPKAKSLPLSAFLLAPIQRLARYPLLVKAVLQHTDEDDVDHPELVDAVDHLEAAVRACNGRLRLLEDRATNERLDARMDYSRLENSVSLAESARSLVLRGPVMFTRMNKGKVTGSKKIDCFLFSDLFMYAKYIKGKKSYLVYKQIHRSLVGVSDVKNGAVGKKRGFFFEITFFGPSPVRLLVDAKSEDAKNSWISALKSNHEQGSAYEEWDCPRGRALKNYNPKQKDEIELREGDVVDILIRNEGGRTKGRVLRNTEFGMLAPVAEGWFPLSVIKEVESTHTQAKMFRQQFNRQESTFTSSHK
eukprot:m.71736 g.71736  ORF g.71736 m.71736 type:complete len:830 (+) comp8362_c0_seq1:139-2628(+)